MFTFNGLSDRNGEEEVDVVRVLHARGTCLLEQKGQRGGAHLLVRLLLLLLLHLLLLLGSQPLQLLRHEQVESVLVQHAKLVWLCALLRRNSSSFGWGGCSNNGGSRLVGGGSSGGSGSGGIVVLFGVGQLVQLIFHPASQVLRAPGKKKERIHAYMHMKNMQAERTFTHEIGHTLDYVQTSKGISPPNLPAVMRIGLKVSASAFASSGRTSSSRPGTPGM